MKLRRLRVSNFRGIKELDWKLASDVVCLVGAGDSTKTTILDAIGFALSPRYSVTFSDADFSNCDTEQSFCIEAVITGLPDEIVAENSLGHHRSGIRRDGELETDPLDDADVSECLIVRLTVDATLEPLWEVVRLGEPEGVRITATQRSQLGFFRVGEFADIHLKWSRGSALSSLTASRSHASAAVLNAQRKARSAVKDLADTPLHDAATVVQVDAIRLGSAHFQDLRPGLDPTLSGSTATLILHEGDVPLSNYGLGSRRLTSLAIQEKALTGRSIVAIDEVEQGLEPHRLTHLMRYLIGKAGDQDLQVLMTTHAPAVIEVLNADQLFVVGSEEGLTTVNQASALLEGPEMDAAQAVMRALPSAFLARQIVIGEGKTEAGFLREYLNIWDRQRATPTDPTAVTTGTRVVSGDGSADAPRRAKALQRLGYKSMLVVDGDAPEVDAAVQAAAEAGVALVKWQDAALEDVVVHALPVEGLQELVELAAEETSEEGVLSQVGLRLGDKLETIDVAGWIAASSDEEVRRAIALAAKAAKVTDISKKDEGKAWFKREDRGERLARVVEKHWEDIGESELAEGLRSVRNFAQRLVDVSVIEGSTGESG